MNEDLKQARMSVMIHIAVGMAVGWLSLMLGGVMYALGLAVVIAIVLGHLTERVIGKNKMTWWVSNGLFVYFFAWFDMWVFLANYF